MSEPELMGFVEWLELRSEICYNYRDIVRTAMVAGHQQQNLRRLLYGISAGIFNR